MKTKTDGMSDSEFVQRLRQNIERFDRLRWVLIAYWGALAIAIVVIVVIATRLIKEMQAGLIPGIGLGFAVGIALGISLGFSVFHVTHGLLTAIFGIGRSERLLVRYHDAISEYSNGLDRGDHESALPPVAAKQGTRF